MRAIQYQGNGTILTIVAAAMDAADSLVNSSIGYDRIVIREEEGTLAIYGVVQGEMPWTYAGEEAADGTLYDKEIPGTPDHEYIIAVIHPNGDVDIVADDMHAEKIYDVFTRHGFE